MFEQDLQHGKKAEIEFAQILINQGKKVLMTEGLNKDFDIATYEEMTLIDTFEVKEDLMYNKTGNIVIEYLSNGNPSGISTTKAKYWVQGVGNKWYVIDTNELKNYIKIIWADVNKKVGGDNATFVIIEPKYLLNISKMLFLFCGILLIRISMILRDVVSSNSHISEKYTLPKENGVASNLP